MLAEGIFLSINSEFSVPNTSDNWEQHRRMSLPECRIGLPQIFNSVFPDACQLRTMFIDVNSQNFVSECLHINSCFQCIDYEMISFIVKFFKRLLSAKIVIISGLPPFPIRYFQKTPVLNPGIVSSGKFLKITKTKFRQNNLQINKI